ncbi:MAG: hypothetical protein ACOY40_04575 [Bacillota bacterium]
MSAVRLDLADNVSRQILAESIDPGGEYFLYPPGEFYSGSEIKDIIKAENYAVLSALYINNVRSLLYEIEYIIPKLDDFAREAFLGNDCGRQVQPLLDGLTRVVEALLPFVKIPDETFRLMEGFLREFVGALEKEDIYRACDRLLQVYDVLKVYREAILGDLKILAGRGVSL